MLSGPAIPRLLPMGGVRGTPETTAPPAFPTDGKVGTTHTNGAGPAAPPREPTAAALAEWIGALRVSQGEGTGQPFRVLPWQADFLAGLADPDTEIAALTVARANGKSAFLAAVASAYMRGPAARERGDVLVVASAFRQARVIFEHALEFLRPEIEAYPRAWKITDNEQAARAEYLPSRARLRAVGSDARKAHGTAFRLALLDEPAQWGTAASGGRELFRTIVTAMGKHPGAKVVALGTRAEGGADDHWFARLCGEAAPGRFAQVFAASVEDDPFDPETWALANPSLPYFPTLRRTLEREANEARTDPEALASFRALRLNTGSALVDRPIILTADDWQACECAELPPAKGRQVWGFDLGSGGMEGAMSAVCAYWPLTGRLEVLAAFPAEPDLVRRGQSDGVGDLYVRMRDRGELLALGRRVVPVRELVRTARDRWGHPDAIAADRWRQHELRESLEAELSPVPFSARGAGWQDGGEDLRRFVAAARTGRVRAPVSLLLRSAMREARAARDSAGNAKLAKRTQGGRRSAAKDDAVAAMLAAVAEGIRRHGSAPVEIPGAEVPQVDPDAAPRRRHFVIGGRRRRRR